MMIYRLYHAWFVWNTVEARHEFFKFITHKEPLIKPTTPISRHSRIVFLLPAAEHEIATALHSPQQGRSSAAKLTTLDLVSPHV